MITGRKINDGSHYFIYGKNDASTYAQIVFCRYCGLVAYDANRDKLSEMGQELAKAVCPNNSGNI